jgi:hypothetical protein
LKKASKPTVNSKKATAKQATAKQATITKSVKEEIISNKQQQLWSK